MGKAGPPSVLQMEGNNPPTPTHVLVCAPESDVHSLQGCACQRKEREKSQHTHNAANKMPLLHCSRLTVTAFIILGIEKNYLRKLGAKNR